MDKQIKALTNDKHLMPAYCQFSITCRKPTIVISIDKDVLKLTGCKRHSYNKINT